MKKKNKQVLLTMFDPDGEYRAKAERIAAFHAQHNPDGVTSVRGATLNGGRMWALQYVIDNEIERIDSMFTAVDEFYDEN